MKVNYRNFRYIPSIVKTACFNYEGWIVGGAAEFLIGKIKPYSEKPKDWDVIVPVTKWEYIFPIVPYKFANVNTFGGFKIFENDIEIDIWPEDLGHFFMGATKGELLAVQPKTQQVAKII